MDILNIKIEDVLKFPFKENNWPYTFGVFTIIELFSTLIISGILLFFLFGGIFALEREIIGLVFIIPACIFFAMFFFINFYLQGYIVEMKRNIKEMKKDPMPKHKDIALKLRLGLVNLGLWIGPMIAILTTAGISTAMIAFGVLNIASMTAISIILITLGVLLAFFSILLLLLSSTMVVPSMLYLYFETKSIKKAYCFKKIKIIIKKMWKEYLLIYAIYILLSFIVSTLGQIPGAGVFFLVIGLSYMLFIVALLTGKIFADLDKLKLFE